MSTVGAAQTYQAIAAPQTGQPRPNLFIVGAQKSGTTSLHAALAEHPEIFMCEPKEPAYFIPPHARPLHVYGDAQTELELLRAYLNLFAEGRAARYRGESSTHYTMAPRLGCAAGPIAGLAPDARIVYIIRDPVERSISHYWWNCHNYDETRPPLEAILANPAYCDVSHYAMQIKPYLEHFSRQNVYMLTTEAFAARPEAELGQLLLWLGVDPGQGRQTKLRRENVTPGIIRQQRLAWLAALRCSRISPSLKGWLPRELHWIPKGLRSLVLRLNERRVIRSEIDLEEVVAHLRPIQRRQTEELADLFKRNFPEWTTLFGARA